MQQDTNRKILLCSALPLFLWPPANTQLLLPLTDRKICNCCSFCKGDAYRAHCISDIKANIARLHLRYANSYVSLGVSAGNLSITPAEKMALAPSLACTAVISAHTKPLATAI